MTKQLHRAAWGVIGLGLLVPSAAVVAQTPVLFGTTVASGGTATVVIIDRATGQTTPYMTVSGIAAGYEARYLSAVPGCKAVASIYRGTTASDLSRLMRIDPAAGTSSIVDFGAPINALYVEGVEYSPRHNALLVGFGALGSFGTNRLALADPATGAVTATSGVISGLSDTDTIVSSATQDLILDLNRTVTPRVLQLTALFPTPAVSAFASPPVRDSWQDGAIDPVSGEVLVVDGPGTQLFRISGNTYVVVANLDRPLRGLAFGPLPPRLGQVSDAASCPGTGASLSVTAVGSGPFTYQWRRNGVPVDVLANPSAATATLSFGSLVPGDAGTYTCVVTNGCGNATSAPAELTVLTCPCGPADIATADGSPTPDGYTNNGDFQCFFANFFNASCVECGSATATACNPADIAQSDASPGPDGCVNNGDFQLFFGEFFAGCV